MSVVSFVEAAIVLEGRSGAAAGHELDEFLEEAGIDLVPVTPGQAQAARRAWRRFGKGNHPAGLNFGDCFAYALAEATREPLLFKGQRLRTHRYRARMTAENRGATGKCPASNRAGKHDHGLRSDSKIR